MSSFGGVHIEKLGDITQLERLTEEKEAVQLQSWGNTRALMLAEENTQKAKTPTALLN